MQSLRFEQASKLSRSIYVLILYRSGAREGGAGAEGGGVATKRASTIGRALREAREAADISQSELGRLTGMSVGQISQIEGGVRASPAFATVQRLAAALHLSLDELAGGAQARSSMPSSMQERIALRRDVAALRSDVAGMLRRLDQMLARLDGETQPDGPKGRKRR